MSKFFFWDEAHTFWEWELEPNFWSRAENSSGDVKNGLSSMILILYDYSHVIFSTKKENSEKFIAPLNLPQKSVRLPTIVHMPVPLPLHPP